MNILLIYPEFPDTFWSFKHALKFIRKKAVSPPLGLLTVAAMLPRDWPRRLVDLNVCDLTDADLTWADYAFVSAMTVQQKSATQVIERCRSAQLKVVAGGPLFTVEPELFDAQVDHFVLNEAELTFPPFLNDLMHGCARHVYTTNDFPDLTLTPIPQWELAVLDHYGTLNIQFSRGCPFNCDFCNVTSMLGHR
ncbi:MAG TPA: cobalamin-dependent protein, partial [Anaerolineae bacterium]|nr:cobalamin-dependent protein [Anaerolineae bacterium]